MSKIVSSMPPKNTTKEYEHDIILNLFTLSIVLSSAYFFTKLTRLSDSVG